MMNLDFNPVVDPQELIEEVPIDELSAEAVNMANSMVKNLSNIYYNEGFMSQHPKLKTRIDIELENLRILIKMRKTDEALHDIAAKAIASNSSNASLYASLTRIQDNLLDIQKQMDSTITNLNNLLKGYQTEINFDAPEVQNGQQETQPKKDDGLSRGSKGFIQQMLKKEEAE